MRQDTTSTYAGAFQVISMSRETVPAAYLLPLSLLAIGRADRGSLAYSWRGSACSGSRQTYLEGPILSAVWYSKPRFVAKAAQARSMVWL